MEAQRQELFAQWEAKLSKAQEAAEAAKNAHQADKEAVQLAATQALASADGKSAVQLCPDSLTFNQYLLRVPI